MYFLYDKSGSMSSYDNDIVEEAKRRIKIDMEVALEKYNRIHNTKLRLLENFKIVIDK